MLVFRAFNTVCQIALQISCANSQNYQLCVRVPSHGSFNNQYHRKKRDGGRGRTRRRKKEKKSCHSDRGKNKSLIVLLSSEVEHFLFLYWPFVSLHLEICLVMSFAIFFC